MATLPNLLSNPFAGILISVIVYAMGSGMIEVLVSPIVEACPFEHKDSVMSLLHSFYCWGRGWGSFPFQRFSLPFFGIEYWWILACPHGRYFRCSTIYNFMTCPIERLTQGRTRIVLQKKLLSIPLFWVFPLADDWSRCQPRPLWHNGHRAYAESALGFSKTIGDIVGPCMFAVSMGLSRNHLRKVRTPNEFGKFYDGGQAFCAWFAICLPPFLPILFLGLIGCIVCGFSVGIMWPGSISIASSKIPLGGTGLFAFLAMAGDLGASIGPAAIGVITQNAGDNMKAGMLAACVFPVILIVSLCLLKYIRLKKQREIKSQLSVALQHFN